MEMAKHLLSICLWTIIKCSLGTHKIIWVGKRRRSKRSVWADAIYSDMTEAELSYDEVPNL